MVLACVADAHFRAYGPCGAVLCFLAVFRRIEALMDKYDIFKIIAFVIGFGALFAGYPLLALGIFVIVGVFSAFGLI